MSSHPHTSTGIANRCSPSMGCSLVDGEPGAASTHLEISKGKAVTKGITEDSRAKRREQTPMIPFDPPDSTFPRIRLDFPIT